jgi:hypothetical protein
MSGRLFRRYLAKCEKTSAGMVSMHIDLDMLLSVC